MQAKFINNTIHGGLKQGVCIRNVGQNAFVNQNKIHSNTGPGIEIQRDGKPTVHQNHIFMGKAEGVIVVDHGGGKIADNDIYENFLAGIAIRTHADPRVVNNR